MDLTHPDVAPETLTAVGEAAGVPYPETEAAAAQRRKLIHAAVENALLALIRSRWPRPEEVTLRKIPPAGGLAVAVTGMEAPDEQEPGILRLRASLAGRSMATERFRCDFLKLLAEFPFIGGEVTTTAGSCIRFGVLSAGEGGTLTEVRENGIPQVSGAAELLLRVDGMNSTFTEAEYPGEGDDSADGPARSAWAALAPGLVWAALAKLLRERYGLNPETAPGDSFREYCSLQLTAAEPLEDTAVRGFRFALEAGSATPSQLRERLSRLAGDLPFCEETVTLPAGSSIVFRVVAGGALSCRSLRQWGRVRLEGGLELRAELDVAKCVPVVADLPGDDALPTRPALDFDALERAIDELLLEKLAVDTQVRLNDSAQLLAGKPWGTRFTHFETDDSGRLTTLFFQVEWSHFERENALESLARLERLFPLYECRLGEVTAAAVLMESNRTVAEQFEHADVTSGAFTLRVCVVY